RYLKGTDFEFMTLHCLRHTNATLLLNSGVDLKIVSEHLGHSDVGTTANIYTDILDSTRKKTAEIIELKLAK
ncbi:MAG: tyrosine-type recombinase/integrase, partial [Lachnospiraceae bacterium]|nr:tyrosine-type recombinase/integrase [Lachnospiraceae bacterium]